MIRSQQLGFRTVHYGVDEKSSKAANSPAILRVSDLSENPKPPSKRVENLVGIFASRQFQFKPVTSGAEPLVAQCVQHIASIFNS